MYGLSIIEDYFDEKGNKDLIESFTTIWFKKDLNGIADAWLGFLTVDNPEAVREGIVNESFHYTHYKRGNVSYTMRVFKVELDAEITLN